MFAAIRLREGPIVFARVRGAKGEMEGLIGRSVKATFTVHSPTQKVLEFQLEANGTISK